MPKFDAVTKRNIQQRSSSNHLSPLIKSSSFDHPSPNPHPARGIYGFVLYLAAWILFIVYLIWALVPDCLLKALHLTYLPAKFWAVAVPSFLLLFIFVYFLANFVYNLIQFHKLFDESENEESNFHTLEMSLAFSRAQNCIVHKCGLCARPLLVVVLPHLHGRHSSGSGPSVTDYSPFAYVGVHAEKKREVKRRYQLAKLQEKERVKNSQSKFKEFVQGIESIAAQRYLRSNIQQFSSLAKAKQEATEQYLQSKRQWEEERKKEKSIASTTNSTFLPYKAESNPNLFESTETVAENEEENILVENDAEKGFFVEEDVFFQDEYAKGTTAELPEDEMTESPLDYIGNLEDAAEHIEFQLPGQESIPKSKKMPKSGKMVVSRRERAETEAEVGDWMSNYGQVEPPPAVADEKEDIGQQLSLPDSKCAACGANFHCRNPSLPGFVPFELFRDIAHNAKKIPFHQKTDYICRRCYLLKEHNFLLNLNVSPVDYAAMMGQLRLQQEPLILLLVDMTDLEASIHRELPNIIGANKPMIVIGNKIDLLPPDARMGYLRHYLRCLKDTVHNIGFTDQFNILKFLLVSAKTGFGVEDLITNIYQKWIQQNARYTRVRSDIYVVGSTNAGKSTLFNAFLQSDLCKVRAMDLVERVTTSIWPGTTLSLLKFPVMSPTPKQLEVRRRRLLSMQAWHKKEEQIRKAYYAKSGDPKYVTLQGIIDSTFKESEEAKQPVSSERTIQYFKGQLEDEEEIGLIEGTVKQKSNMTLNDRVFLKGRWCFDTPGTVNSEQVLDLFTLDELINIVPRSIIVPRIFALQAHQTLLVGGVARVDVLRVESIRAMSPPVLLTVFASKCLKLNVMKTRQVNDFLRKFNGHPSLGAPIGDAERLERLPKLESRDFEATNEAGTSEVGFADVVLSSLGWTLVTSRATAVKIRAWTPAGKGLHLRQPPLLPYAADYRGVRIPQSAAFTTRHLRDIETFSETQRTLPPKRIVGQNFAAPESDHPVQFVNFDLA